MTVKYMNQASDLGSSSESLGQLSPVFYMIPSHRSDIVSDFLGKIGPQVKMAGDLYNVGLGLRELPAAST